MTPRSSRRIAILVVEDEPLLRMTLADMLDARGFLVREAANAEQALKELEAHPDLVLIFTDIQMPGPCDGLELLRRVHQRWPHVLLMVTSGQLRPRVDELPDDTRFLPKPLNERDVLQQMRELMAKHGEPRPEL